MTNTGSIEASGTSFNSFPQTFGIEVGGALVRVGGGLAGPNGGTLIGDIVNANTGTVTVTATGTANGNAGAGATGIRLNLATAGVGGSPGVFNGNIFNAGTIMVSANGAGLFAHGIDVGTSTANAGLMTGGIFNSGSLTATGTNGATGASIEPVLVTPPVAYAPAGVGISVISAVGGGITNTGTLMGSTAAIDLTQEVGGSTNIIQAGGTMTGNILGSGHDTLSITGGSLVLAPTGVVNGLASFNMLPAGVLALQVTPTQAPVITVNGIATLSGGSVQVQPQPGTYALQTRYTILTAANGVLGQFANATTTSAFLGATLTYDANDVFLTLSKAGIFSTQATTANQRNVAAALDVSSFNSALVLAALTQTVPGAQQAFDALSGELHASIHTTLLNDSLFAREAVLGRLRQVSFGGVSGPLGLLGAGGPQVASAQTGGTSVQAANVGVPGALAGSDVVGSKLAYAQTADAYQPAAYALADVGGPAFPTQAAPAPVWTPDWTWWSQGVGAWGRFDGDGNAAETRDRLAGFFTGVDRRFGDHWRAGIASGYSNSRVSVDARASTANIDTAHFAAYAGGNWGGLDFRSGGAFAWNTIGANRAVVFPGFADADTTRYEASTDQIFGEVARAGAFGNVAVEPFLGLAYMHLHTDGFTESGGPTGLAGAATDQGVGDLSLGARLATSLAGPNGTVLVPRTTVFWQHAIGSVIPSQALTFVSTAAPFTVAGAPLARNAGVVDAGLDVWPNPRARIGLSYFGELAQRVQDHAVKGNFTLSLSP